MSLAAYFPSQELAEAALESEGFEFVGEFWRKQSKVDDYYGGYPKLALVSVEHRHVAPEFNEPDYFEIKFHC